eukprot:scaffold4446_cov272-Chaetoceros_neogracile.AAC.3
MRSMAFSDSKFTVVEIRAAVGNEDGRYVIVGAREGLLEGFFDSLGSREGGSVGTLVGGIVGVLENDG